MDAAQPRHPSQPFSAPAPLALIGDIGATNARFALVEGGVSRDVEILPCADHASLEEAIRVYLAHRGGARPLRAALCVAGPVTGDRVAFTNHPWAFSTAEMRERLGLERLSVMNDFAAVARALPAFAAADTVGLGGPMQGQPGNLACLGPGSGLGVASLALTGTREAPGWAVLAGEGGHVSLPAVTPREQAVLEQLQRRFGHVSAERVLSGQGLENLWQALAELDGEGGAMPRAPEIGAIVLAGGDARAVEVMDLFAAWLGTIAGNLVLTVGAWGGVWIAGGIVPRLQAAFPAARFRDRFEAKGRMGPLMAEVPTRLVVHPLPAFVGLQAAVAA